MQTYRFTTQSLPSTFVGFDHMFNELDRLAQAATTKVSYPPYNIKKIDEDNFVIQLAVAGFSKEDIDVTIDGSQLVVKGQMKADPEAHFIHKGIAERDFERVFPLAEHVYVKSAATYNGLLNVYLERKIPEALKPRKIDILDDDIPTIKVDTKKLAA